MSTLLAILSKQYYQGLLCLPFLAVWSVSTRFTILSSLIRVYTACHSQQSGPGLHHLLFSAVWSGSTLFAILSMQHYQGLHCLPFSAFWSESTLLSILSSLIKVKVYTVILMNNLISVYTICHSQQSGQGLHYFPFSAVRSRSRSTLSFSGIVWSGSTLLTILSSLVRDSLFAILSSLIKVKVHTVILRNSLVRVYTACYSQQSDQRLQCLPFSAVLSGSILFGMFSNLIRVHTICHSQQFDQGLHCLPFSAV